MNVIECTGLTKEFGTKKAVHDLSFAIEENGITGLIGRNGAGKTTLLKMLAGLIRETRGEIKVFSERPFNSLKVSANLIFVDEHMSFPATMNLKEILYTASSFYGNWDMELANRLFEYFSFDPKQNHQSLSKGMRSTFNMILGIAARCPLTIFDEPTTGMDKAVRNDFYRALLKDYIDYPRTIILSSHLFNEVEDILEDVLLIKSGEKCLHLPIEELKEYAIGLSGKTEAIDEWTKDKEILHQKSLGKDSSYVVVKNDLTESVRQSIRLAGIEITPVNADDVCVYLTSEPKGGIDDVFHRG